ncbi:MAG: type I methionyl aminopeptidase [Candidatus Daviesbacteria bacterium]|nr:type I methionyl aminopeptidase [Candidatus Daviesbacteria bacterium]
MSPRSSSEIALIRESGRISAIAMKKVLDNIKAGVSCLELEKLVAEEIKSLGGEIAFAKVPGYKWATCITINDEVVHGIPTNRLIKEGDLVSIDLGAVYKGWYSDTAWSVIVGQVDSETKKFLQVGEQALWQGIKEATDGNHVGDISTAIQTVVEGASYSVVRSLVGHGIGKNLHEDPEVPGFGKSGTGLKLKTGMSLAVEVIYTKGKPEVVLEDDNWTISSADGSLGGLFEMTVIVGKEKAEVLTDWRSA